MVIKMMILETMEVILLDKKEEMLMIISYLIMEGTMIQMKASLKRGGVNLLKSKKETVMKIMEMLMTEEQERMKMRRIKEMRRFQDLQLITWSNFNPVQPTFTQLLRKLPKKIQSMMVQKHDSSKRGKGHHSKTMSQMSLSSVSKLTGKI